MSQKVSRPASEDFPVRRVRRAGQTFSQQPTQSLRIRSETRPREGQGGCLSSGLLSMPELGGIHR